MCKAGGGAYLVIYDASESGFLLCPNGCCPWRHHDLQTEPDVSSLQPRSWRLENTQIQEGKTQSQSPVRDLPFRPTSAAH